MGKVPACVLPIAVEEEQVAAVGMVVAEAGVVVELAGVAGAEVAAASCARFHFRFEHFYHSPYFHHRTLPWSCRISNRHEDPLGPLQASYRFLELGKATFQRADATWTPATDGYVNLARVVCAWHRF